VRGRGILIFCYITLVAFLASPSIEGISVLRVEMHLIGPVIVLTPMSLRRNRYQHIKKAFLKANTSLSSRRRRDNSIVHAEKQQEDEGKEHR